MKGSNKRSKLRMFRVNIYRPFHRLFTLCFTVQRSSLAISTLNRLINKRENSRRTKEEGSTLKKT